MQLQIFPNFFSFAATVFFTELINSAKVFCGRVLSRWYEQEGYRRSLAEHNVGEKEIMLYDRIALGRHDYTATRAERLQNAKHWVLRLIADGSQKPLRQRQESAEALKNNA